MNCVGLTLSLPANDFLLRAVDVMESVLKANELVDEPKDIAVIVKDCADGNPDEDITQQGIDRVKESVRTCQKLLEAVGSKE